MIRTLKVIKKNSFHGDNVRDSHTVAAGGRRQKEAQPAAGQDKIQRGGKAMRRSVDEMLREPM